MKKCMQMLSCLCLTSLMCCPWNAAAGSSDVMEEVEPRITAAIENCDIYVDLSDLNIQVNMYSDRFSEEYQEFLSLADSIVSTIGSYEIGSIQKPFCRIDFDSTPSPGNTDPYGTGKNDLTGAGISYDHDYFEFGEKPDKDYFDELKTTVSENYRKALSLADSRMSDVEKALILYDYIIAASNYPDSIGFDDEGNENFEDRYHSAVNLFYEGLAVCSGNAEAYAGLLRDSGIRAIVVESKEMDHEWVMLELDGAWFHADPTWDNYRYEFYTECYDYTDDPWDLGAAAHDYFLKSDEEIQELYHYGWERKAEDLDFGITELPAADQSGVWENHFFSQYIDGGSRSRFNYIDGVWYFLDRNQDRVIAYQDGEYSTVDLMDEMKYVHGDGTYLFFCTDEAVFAYDPQTEEQSMVISASDYGKNAVISEMRVVCDRIDIVILTGPGSDGSYSSLSESWPLSALKFQSSV